jgi:hypothetical protein
MHEKPSDQPMPTMPPILVAGLFREIGQHLVNLLRSLSADEWHLPTSSSQRNIKDIASHLLDGSLCRLSMQRDGYLSPNDSSRMRSDETLLDFLNRLNADWEKATRRLSPSVLLGLIEWAYEQLADLFESLDPFAPAIFPVAWAGEGQSENWMDVARDYTEKWHHTQQIFEAARRPSTITQRRLFHPCLNTFMRALPFTFRSVPAEVGTAVIVTVTGEAGDNWYVERGDDGWRQVTRPTGCVRSNVILDQISAWKLVTKRRSREATLAELPDIRIEGDVDLGSHVIDMVSMMA